MALRTQRLGGAFVLKVSDSFFRPTQDLIRLLVSCYD